jgi:NAD(P)-dependent dehydrogenase (short-subunit alcohol dehydrogenase family)
MELGLEGKIALITGGSRGIGLGVAKGLAAEGVHVAFCARDSKEVKAVSDDLEKTYDIRAVGVAADVSRAADIVDFVNLAVRELGGTDILINNAGVGSEETIMDSPDEKWQYYWDMQVMAAVRMSRAVVPHMKKRGGGVIINNASICARQPLSHEPIYNTVKAALAMFSKCLANELIRDNIRVNCINPGLIMTPAWRAGAESLALKEGLSVDAYFDTIAAGCAPTKRFATPEELAHFFVFLCSDRASYCVGSTYYVDGGWLKATV